MTYTPEIKKKLKIGLYGGSSIYIGYIGQKPFYTAGPVKYNNIISSSAPTLNDALKRRSPAGYTWHNEHQKLFFEWFKTNINQ